MVEEVRQVCDLAASNVRPECMHNVTFLVCHHRQSYYFLTRRTTKSEFRREHDLEIAESQCVYQTQDNSPPMKDQD